MTLSAGCLPNLPSAATTAAFQPTASRSVSWVTACGKLSFTVVVRRRGPIRPWRRLHNDCAAPPTAAEAARAAARLHVVHWGLVPIAEVERHAKAQMRGFDQLSRDLRDMINAGAHLSKRAKKRGVK
jgi:hypothetical protein